MARHMKTMELQNAGESGDIVGSAEVQELLENLDMLTEQNEVLRKEKYQLQKQVDEVDDKLNNMHMIICDLENEKRELQTQYELLKTTSRSSYQFPTIDPNDPRIQSRLDQFGLLPPPHKQGVLEGIFEFLFPFLF